MARCRQARSNFDSSRCPSSDQNGTETVSVPAVFISKFVARMTYEDFVLRRNRAGGDPKMRLKARLNAASDS